MNLSTTTKVIDHQYWFDSVEKSSTDISLYAIIAVVALVILIKLVLDGCGDAAKASLAEKWKADSSKKNAGNVSSAGVAGIGVSAAGIGVSAAGGLSAKSADTQIHV